MILKASKIDFYSRLSVMGDHRGVTLNAPNEIDMHACFMGVIANLSLANSYS